MNKNIYEFIKTNQEDANNIAIALVIQTWGSAPMKIGSIMAVNQMMGHSGSVSGGCVESDVISRSLNVIQSKISEIVKYSISDDLALGFGLACGGNLEIIIFPLDNSFMQMLSDLINKNITKYFQIDLTGSLNIKYQKSEFHRSKPYRENIEGVDFFFGVFSPYTEIIIIGGGEISVELSNLASNFGFIVTIIEPRKAFNSEERFQDAVHIVPKWPDEAFSSITLSNNSAVIALSHDPKFDDPALIYALKSDAFYIGALGSSRSHKKRLERLESSNIDNMTLKRIKSPIGIDIGAETASEISLSIMADIVNFKNKGF